MLSKNDEEYFENKIKNKQERYLILAQRGISALKEVLDV